MSNDNHPNLAKAYLEELCQRLDRKEKLVRRREWWKMPWIASAAVGLALSGCGGTVEAEDCGPNGDACGTENVDKGDKGKDTDAAPPVKEVCDNRVDDDGDGAVDCDDDDCLKDPSCMISAEYAAPFEVEVCDNQVDDDGDGAVDCDDDDCLTEPMCMNSAEYAAPFEVEVCDNQVDDDGDGAVDCDDDDCLGSPTCGAGMYAAP
ncbi:MAG: hypothetical protein BWY17_02298 [Deltaproteobacteria bacterium ADurb.Bin207]|jgi:hypothetical protein|nr:MAG: hypothetical protein BWY17_02298 [Deltaproteobacteria bacterium ADurb.Bin207]HPB98627.1 hypothetical protein [Polyangiaceae bacterium]